MSCQEMKRLLEIMRKLRSEEGCPWDRKQNHRSLRPYLLEEAYEVLDAIERENVADMKEELGDLLLQVVFHSVIAEEKGEFSFSDVVFTIAEKLVRRHPHVFGDAEANNAEEVIKKWEKIKALEKKDEQKEGSLLDNVPETLPALSLAQKIQEKAAGVGFDWPDITGARDKLLEEINEFYRSLETGDSDSIEEELGDILFALVNVARFLHIDAELALRRTVRKFRNRFKFIEESLAREGRLVDDSSLEEMDSLWNKAKEKKIE